MMKNIMIVALVASAIGMASGVQASVRTDTGDCRADIEWLRTDTGDCRTDTGDCRTDTGDCRTDTGDCRSDIEWLRA
jgi:hypothetical protein